MPSGRLAVVITGECIDVSSVPEDALPEGYTLTVQELESVLCVES